MQEDLCWPGEISTSSAGRPILTWWNFYFKCRKAYADLVKSSTSSTGRPMLTWWKVLLQVQEGRPMQTCLKVPFQVQEGLYWPGKKFYFKCRKGCLLIWRKVLLQEQEGLYWSGEMFHFKYRKAYWSGKKYLFKCRTHSAHFSLTSWWNVLLQVQDTLCPLFTDFLMKSSTSSAGHTLPTFHRLPDEKFDFKCSKGWD